MKRDTRKNDINPLATNRSETKIPTEGSGVNKGNILIFIPIATGSLFRQIDITVRNLFL